MARKSFHINTEPHEAEIGDKILHLVPEANGAEFATAYGELMEAQLSVGDGTDPAALTLTNNALKKFLSKLVVPEDQKWFEAAEIPTRVLVQLSEWVAELYGGGPGNDQPTS